jgi:hypothetical protein
LKLIFIFIYALNYNFMRSCGVGAAGFGGVWTLF